MANNFPLKVLHISSGDLWAGAEVQLYTLATTLHVKFDVPHSVVLFNHGTLEMKLRESGINVFVLDETKLNSLNILIGLIRIIRQQKPNIVHTHRTKENILGGLAALLSGNLTSVRTVHGAPEHHPPWYYLSKRLINFIDWVCGYYFQRKIISVSDELAQILSNEFPKDKICVINNGIDVDTLQTQITIKNDNNKYKKMKSINIGIAGRLVPVKRIDLFIQSAKFLRDHYPEIVCNFYIYGDGPLLSNLKELSVKLNVNDILYFEGHCNNIYSKISELDILLITSDHEGLPMILLEAMSLGIPVISHAVGGIPNLLCNGNCGVLVSDHSASGYANAINETIKSPDKVKNMVANGLEQVKSNYSAENNAKAYLKLYTALSAQNAN